MRRLLLAYSLCLCLSVVSTSAETWVVLPDSTGDAPTIQAGIDSASAGDTVLVNCGTYYEHDIQMKSGICLTSLTGTPDCAIIDAQDLGRGIRCEFVDSTTSIVGLAFVEGNAGEYTGGGFYCSKSYVKVVNCAFRHNLALGGGGGARIASGSPILTNCEFSSNVTCGYWSMGAAVLGGGTAMFVDCVFSSNGHTLCHGGAFGGSGELVTFSGCLFEGNRGMGGALMFDGGSVVLTDCTIAANVATAGGAGIEFFNPTDARLENCIIAFNTGGAAIEGIGLISELPELSCCNLYCNAHGDWKGDLADQWGVNGNISKDPLFCDVASGDFRLCQNSPCLDSGTCGTIGAYAAGCSACVDEHDWVDVTTTILGESSHGSGLAWVDYDDDGDLDIFVTSRTSENFLLRNDNLTAEGFVDATPPVLADSADSKGCPWGDYDNDGDPDLYVSIRGNNKLLRNDGNGCFTDVTTAPLDDAGAGQAAGWFDYDNDGDLDLYVVNNGPNKLFRNDSSAAFADATTGPLGDSLHGTGLALADYDSDGDIDIYVANHNGANVLLQNQDGGGFVDVTTPVLACPVASFGAAWGDYDNDGDPDLYVTNDGANKLLRNDGGAFTDVSSPPVDNMWIGRSASWFDYDNDGDLDLYLANEGANCVFRNEGSETFEQVGCGCHNGNARSAGWGDYDNDGDLDFYVVNFGINKLFRNDLGSDNHWFEIDPVGVLTNRAGVGARVRIVAGGVSQMREIVGISGYASQDPLTARFGLGAECTVDTVEVTWPMSGVVQVLTGLICDQTLEVVEDLSSGIPDKEKSPTAFSLYPNRPNPFAATTAIRYDLPEHRRVDLTIYDASGRAVRTLLSREYEDPGRHEAHWDGRNGDGEPVAPGIYFCRFTAGPYTETRSLVLLK